jgi:cell wall-associated NlpC family hydrolase
VCTPATHLYPAPNLKIRETAALSLGARLCVTGQDNGFAQTGQGWVPVQHITPLTQPARDPVAVARGFLGVPYLWGGNSHAGLDCSALVQAALHACGAECPGDSDQQAAMPWAAVPPGHEQPGDLVFWRGHVAMVSAPGMIIHANAHHMAVAEEPMQPAIDRIAAKGDTVTAILRPSVAVP